MIDTLNRHIPRKYDSQLVCENIVLIICLSYFHRFSFFLINTMLLTPFLLCLTAIIAVKLDSHNFSENPKVVLSVGSTSVKMGEAKIIASINLSNIERILEKLTKLANNVTAELDRLNRASLELSKKKSQEGNGVRLTDKTKSDFVAGNKTRFIIDRKIREKLTKIAKLQRESLFRCDHVDPAAKLVLLTANINARNEVLAEVHDIIINSRVNLYKPAKIKTVKI